MTEVLDRSQIWIASVEFLLGFVAALVDDVTATQGSAHQVGAPDLLRRLVKFTNPPVSRERWALAQKGAQKHVSCKRSLQFEPMNDPPKSQPEIRNSNFWVRKIENRSREPVEFRR